MRMIRNILSGLADLLREISDQNAYQRHLAEHGVVHSAEEWRRSYPTDWSRGGTLRLPSP